MGLFFWVFYTGSKNYQLKTSLSLLNPCRVFVGNKSVAITVVVKNFLQKKHPTSASARGMEST